MNISYATGILLLTYDTEKMLLDLYDIDIAVIILIKINSIIIYKMNYKSKVYLD